MSKNITNVPPPARQMCFWTIQCARDKKMPLQTVTSAGAYTPFIILLQRLSSDEGSLALSI